MWFAAETVPALRASSVAVLVAAATLWAPSAHAPDVAPAAALAPRPASCKPMPPLAVHAEAAGGAAGRWSLALRSLDVDRDVRVWMQSNDSDRREVWSGRLSALEERYVEVQFAPAAGADRVLVALEPRETGDAIVRSFAEAAVPGALRGRAQIAEEPNGVLLVDPNTGVRVRQYTGAVGGQR